MPDSVLRQPRASIRVAGEAVTGWTEAEVSNNIFHDADGFSVTFAVSQLPPNRGAGWFSQQTAIEIEIFANANPSDPANYSGSDADRLILGQVDDIDYDSVGTKLTVSGRDFTAKLIDTKSSEHFLNQTASQVAATLAGRHGLTPVVTATGARVGDYFKSDHSDLTQQQSEWELLTRLAEYEDFAVYVKGRELHFEAKPSGGAKTYPVQWHPPTNASAAPQAAAVGLKFSRSLTIVKGLKVEVRSWNGKQKKAIVGAWPKTAQHTRPGTSGSSAADEQVYRYTIAGLTPDQALKRAQSIYQQLASHAMKLDAELPGDAVLDCTMGIAISGTGTAWDQTYYPTEVKRTISAEDGFTMTVTAKNISPELETQ
jgi:phage protein D